MHTFGPETVLIKKNCADDDLLESLTDKASSEHRSECMHTVLKPFMLIIVCVDDGLWRVLRMHRTQEEMYAYLVLKPFRSRTTETQVYAYIPS